MKLTTLSITGLFIIGPIIAGLLIAGSLPIRQDDGLDTLPKGFVIDQPKQVAQRLPVGDIESQLRDAVQDAIKTGRSLTKYEDGLVSAFITLRREELKATQEEQEKRQAVAIAKAQEWDRICAKSDADRLRIQQESEQWQAREEADSAARRAREEAESAASRDRMEAGFAAAKQQETLDGIRQELQEQTNILQEEQLYQQMRRRY